MRPPQGGAPKSQMRGLSRRPPKVQSWHWNLSRDRGSCNYRSRNRSMVRGGGQRPRQNGLQSFPGRFLGQRIPREYRWFRGNPLVFRERAPLAPAQAAERPPGSVNPRRRAARAARRPERSGSRRSGGGVTDKAPSAPPAAGPTRAGAGGGR